MTNEEAWNYAIGIVQVDGIRPSDDFLELVEKEKRGEMRFIPGMPWSRQARYMRMRTSGSPSI